MKCPKCDKILAPKSRRFPTGIKYTVHRDYICNDCKIHFKSTEKILFTTLPKNIKDDYLDNHFADGRGQI